VLPNARRQQLILCLSATTVVIACSIALGRLPMWRLPSSDRFQGGRQESPSVHHAAGTFDVRIAPQTPAWTEQGLGRSSIDKQFKGELEATSKGEMITAGTDVKDSAAYCALERVTGTLAGHSGSFTLQHTGVMTRGKGELTITVVPDSGTGELAGLSGTMRIVIAEGKHSYEFDYTLAGR